MKFKIFGAIFFWLMLFSLACKNDDIDFSSPAANLKFSRDTLRLDTVYGQTRSETYAVTVYNLDDKDVTIPEIALEGGDESPYRINLDGKAGTKFTNVPLRSKDSLYVFVEIAPKATAPQALAQDKLSFATTSGKKSVTLLSVVEDAEYFVESATNSNILKDNTTWTNSKAKIIYGKLTLAENKTLTIEAGTRVYFAKNSSLEIAPNATVNINGDLGKEVILRGDRNETKYDTIPLNWKGITAKDGAKININYAKIFGGETALELNNTTANISNSVISIFQNYGILAVGSNIDAKNLVMNHFGTSAVGIYKGGTASFVHCTIANFWDFNSSFPANTLFATNEYINGTKTEYGNLNLTIRNSIFYGKSEDPFIIKPAGNFAVNYFIDSSLLKTGKNAGFNLDGNPNVVNTIKNSDPKFLRTFGFKMNLSVAPDSPAKGKGNPTAAQLVPQDILKKTRTSSPTIGAYQ